MKKILLVLMLSLPLLVVSSVSEKSHSQSESGINWGKICRNSLVDSLISEPCSSLTTPDGYTLTSNGEKVISCIGGGTLSVLLGMPELLTLAPAVGCGSSSSVSNSDSGLGGILQSLFN